MVPSQNNNRHNTIFFSEEDREEAIHLQML